MIQLRPICKFYIFLGKIKLQLDQRRKAYQPLPQIPQLPRKSAPDRMQSRPGSGGTLAGDEIANRFGLGQIQLAIEKSPLRKLPRPGQPGPLAQQRPDDTFLDIRAAMTGDLNNIFTGIRPRGPEQRNHHLIERLLPFLQKPDMQCMRRLNS